jgi:hypothetical protein
MVAVLPIEPVRRMIKPGSQPCDPRRCLLAVHRKLGKIVPGTWKETTHLTATSCATDAELTLATNIVAAGIQS